MSVNVLILRGASNTIFIEHIRLFIRKPIRRTHLTYFSSYKVAADYKDIVSTFVNEKPFRFSKRIEQFISR